MVDNKESDIVVGIKNVFDFGESKIKVTGTVEDPWFCARDVAKILGYTNLTKAIKDNVDLEDRKTLAKIVRDDKLNKLSYHEAISTYLNKQGIVSFLIKSKRPSKDELIQWFYKTFDICIENIGYLKKEQDTVGCILRAFKGEEMETQYFVGTYFIDLYFPEHKIAIECDEFGIVLLTLNPVEITI